MDRKVGALYAPIGHYPDGRPIYAMAGGDEAPVAVGSDPHKDMGPQIAELTAKLEQAVTIMADSKDDDSARWAEANKAREEHGNAIQALVEAKEAKDRTDATAKAQADLETFLASVRNPSKAGAIGGNGYGAGFDGSPGQADGEAGDFLLNVYLSRSSDAEDQMRGKSGLKAMGLQWEEPWGVKDGGAVANPASIAGRDSRVEAHPNGGYSLKAKATLGTSTVTGQAIIPNAIVDALQKPAMYDHPFRTLLTTVPGVTAYAVDLPVREGAPSRAVIAPFGDTKENRDLAYQAYTATMFTMALIYDIGKQFVRQSAGAAEQDVMSELAHAFALGEAYYILNGAGTTEPFGLLPALTGATSEYTTSHTAAATIAGASATAIAKSAGALAARNRTPSGVLCNAADYWTMVAQGADAAGYYIAGQGSGPSNINPGTGIPGGPAGLRIWGIPVFPDSTIASDRMVIGDWKALKLYLGESYRVDSSDVAGDRWDKNLVGFRGEMEVGLDARPAVIAGAFQEVTNFVP